MKIEEEEPLLARHVLKLAPRANARQGCIPASGSNVGRLTQPEVARTKQAKAVRAIEDGTMLATAYAVVAAYADVPIGRQTRLQIVQLSGQTFLRTENVGSKKIDLCAKLGQAPLPTIPFQAVGRILVAHIVGADEQGLRMYGDGRQQGDDK